MEIALEKPTPEMVKELLEKSLEERLGASWEVEMLNVEDGGVQFKVFAWNLSA